jgi:predicted O-methyltransferase YrrM
MDNEVLIALSYCGSHQKSNTTVRPREHMQCLLACLKQYKKYPLIISAIQFFTNLRDDEERILSWEIHKRAKIITTAENPGHQPGAAWTIRLALEYAVAMGFEYLFFSADDIIFYNPDKVERTLARMKEQNLGYIGTVWEVQESLNAQVFCIRVKDYASDLNNILFNAVDFHASRAPIEHYFYRITVKNKIKYEALSYHSRENDHLHSHNPREILAICRRMNLIECPNIEEAYRLAYKVKSDISEHIPLLNNLAKECKHITELGRHEGNSTIAFLAAKPEKLISYDTNEPDEIYQTIKNYGNLELIVADTRQLEIEETDLMFIDSEHTYNHLTLELLANGNKAKKYLIFHDTITFGAVGSDGNKGIDYAIRNFMDQNKHWKLHSCHHNNNGLMILKRT